MSKTLTFAQIPHSSSLRRRRRRKLSQKAFEKLASHQDDRFNVFYYYWDFSPSTSLRFEAVEAAAAAAACSHTPAVPLEGVGRSFYSKKNAVSFPHHPTA